MAIRRRTERTEYRIALTVSALTFEDRLVLVDRAASRLFLYNESARLIWNGVAGGRNIAAVVAELSNSYRVPAKRLRADLDVVLDHWVVEGLVERSGGSSAARRTVPLDMRIKDEVSETNPSVQRSKKWLCTLGAHPIEFDIEGEEWVSLVRRMFAHLETPCAQPELSISVRQVSPSQFCLAEDGRERLRTDNSGLLIGGLYQTLLERIHPGIEWLALIHGGAVAKRDTAVVLPAPSGSGKTTLLAYLMTQGFRYLADDLVALAAPEGVVVPWPMPLSVKSGSWDVVAEVHPQMNEAPTFLTRGIETRLLVPPQDAWNVDRTPARAIIFPRYNPASAGELLRISSVDALQHLLADRIWLGHPLAEDRVRAFLAWLKDIPAYTLTYSNLSHALRGIEKALAP